MAGIAYPSSVDEDDEAFLLWEAQQLNRRTRLTAGECPPHQQHRSVFTPTQQLPSKTVHSSVDSPQEDPSQRLASLGVGIASLFSENVLSHPCIVIRRQCQVHPNSRRYHLTPFTIFSVAINLQRRQGLNSFWKGLGSVFIVRGITLGAENLFSQLIPLPKEVTIYSSWKTIAKHLCLKSLSFLVMTPFYSTSLIETIQSDIASEKPEIFDCIKEGILRVFRVNFTSTTRLLPMWHLFGPTIMCHVLHYILSSVVQFCTLRYLQMKADKQKESTEAILACKMNTADNCLLEITAEFTGRLAADVILYPMETVLNRLHVQGTRTIIDNLDSGLEVIPILTKYEGATDCFRSIIADEGTTGLYKGFGALIIQYFVRVAILRLTKFVLVSIQQM